MRCVPCSLRFKKLGSHRKTDWEQPVSECSQITGSAAAKPFTIRIFTSYPLSEAKRLELPRQGESWRRRNTSRSRISCARPGPNNVQNFTTRATRPSSARGHRQFLSETHEDL